MIVTEVGKEASQQTGGEIYFRTYHELLRQKERIDRDILKLQGKFFKAISKTKDILPVGRGKYIPRLKNTKILVKAIRECMTLNQQMTMEDILKSLSKKNLYHTNSKYFYTMVNNKLNRDSKIKKISRGIFVYTPQSGEKSDAVV